MMLTLVLLVGAVSCSPVPSEPSFPASVARHGTSPAGAAHVEATHEARQVTFEVIEEVGDTILSTTSSDLSGEDDPPIPTATTPPVLPESEAQEANPAVTEPHHTPPQQQQQQQQQHETDPYFSHGSPLVIESHESHDIHLHSSSPQSQTTSHHDSQNSSSRPSSFQRQISSPEVIELHGANSGDTHSDTRPQVIQSHDANPEATLSLEKNSQDTLPHQITKPDSEPASGKASSETVTSKEDSTERSASSHETPTSQSSEHGQLQASEKQPPHETSVNHDSNESSQQVSVERTKVQNGNNTSEVSAHHHSPVVETVVEAELHSWESSEHRHFPSSTLRGDTQDAATGEDLADVENQGVTHIATNGNNRSLPLREAAREATVLIGHSLELMKDETSDIKDGKVEYIDSGALSTDTEEDITDEITPEGQQQGSGIQVRIAGERAQPSEESDSTDQTHERSDSLKKDQKHENQGRELLGEVEVVPSLLMDSSSPIDIVERSEEAEKEVLEGAASETVLETDLTPAEVAAGTDRRRSRIYVKSSDEDQTSDTASVENQKESENRSDTKMIGGLESMSMTSPTPDTSLVGEPQASEDNEATIAPPETFADNENTTIIENEGKVERNEESAAPAPTAGPPPTEPYTDDYSDPISSANLPDVMVTQEEVPSRDRPLTDLPLLSTSDKETSGNLRTQGGVAWVLPPQQEQVSAVAPDSLTPGCIVAIVFGVIISVTVVLGIGGFVVWQRRTLNRPKVLGSDRGYAGSDSGGYIDDQVRVSYVNSQIDSPKGSPEDLISLDNDSFLNSLESMTIQNLWTDNIRHTKL